MIWLIGCKGMLGSEIAHQLDEHNIPWVGSDAEVDITDPLALEAFASAHDRAATKTGGAVSKGKTHTKINWVINCAAFTDVNRAESQAELAEKLNEAGPRNIARTARQIGAKLIHISTDYVFDGTATEPYTEQIEKAPLGVYGKTKAAGEDAVQKEMTQYYILRTAWLYGFDGKNFVYTMTKAMNTNESVQVVNDQRGSPTCTTTLASVILKIIETSEKAPTLFGKNSALPYGIYHCTDIADISWFDFAQKIYSLGKKYGRINTDCSVNPCSTQDYPTPAQRPAYSVLNKDKLQKALKIKLPDWEESLEKFIKSPRFKADR